MLYTCQIFLYQRYQRRYVKSRKPISGYVVPNVGYVGSSAIIPSRDRKVNLWKRNRHRKSWNHQLVGFWSCSIVSSWSNKTTSPHAVGLFLSNVLNLLDVAEQIQVHVEEHHILGAQLCRKASEQIHSLFHWLNWEISWTLAFLGMRPLYCVLLVRHCWNCSMIYTKTLTFDIKKMHQVKQVYQNHHPSASKLKYAINEESRTNCWVSWNLRGGLPPWLCKRSLTAGAVWPDRVIIPQTTKTHNNNSTTIHQIKHY